MRTDPSPPFKQDCKRQEESIPQPTPALCNAVDDLFTAILSLLMYRAPSTFKLPSPILVGLGFTSHELRVLDQLGHVRMVLRRCDIC